RPGTGGRPREPRGRSAADPSVGLGKKRSPVSDQRLTATWWRRDPSRITAEKAVPWTVYSADSQRAARRTAPYRVMPKKRPTGRVYSTDSQRAAARSASRRARRVEVEHHHEVDRSGAPMDATGDERGIMVPSDGGTVRRAVGRAGALL